MLSPAAPWQPSSPQAGKGALTLFSVESSTPSLLPAFRCGPMPASQPPDFPSPTPRALGLIISRASSFYLMIGSQFSSSLCNASPVPVVTKHNVSGRSRVTILGPGCHHSFNMLDAFMHH